MILKSIRSINETNQHRRKSCSMFHLDDSCAPFIRYCKRISSAHWMLSTIRLVSFWFLLRATCLMDELSLWNCQFLLRFFTAKNKIKFIQFRCTRNRLTVVGLKYHCIIYAYEMPNKFHRCSTPVCCLFYQTRDHSNVFSLDSLLLLHTM